MNEWKWKSEQKQNGILWKLDPINVSSQFCFARFNPWARLHTIYWPNVHSYFRWNRALNRLLLHKLLEHYCIKSFSKMMIKPILSQDMGPMKAPVISHRQLISVTNNICKWVCYFFSKWILLLPFWVCSINWMIANWRESLSMVCRCGLEYHQSNRFIKATVDLFQLNGIYSAVHQRPINQLIRFHEREREHFFIFTMATFRWPLWWICWGIFLINFNSLDFYWWLYALYQINYNNYISHTNTQRDNRIKLELCIDSWFQFEFDPKLYHLLNEKCVASNR